MRYTAILRELREDKDLSQKQVAEVLQMTQSAYAKYENERNRLSIDDLITLCLYYHVSADYILGLPKGLDWPR